jgi:hypothetical protein
VSAVPAIRRALIGLLGGLYRDAQVTYGPPVQLAARMAYINAARIPTNIQPTTSGGPRRSRDETAEVDVVLSCFRPGDTASVDDAQQQVSDDAWAMYATLENHFRSRDAAPLTPASRDAIADHADEQIYPAIDTDEDGTEVTIGWICDITVTVTTTTRLA